MSIALRNREEILLGVVYEVCRDECFWTYKGAPAYCNDRQIRVSQVAVPDEAFMAFGLPYETEAYKPVFNRLIEGCYGHEAATGMWQAFGWSVRRLPRCVTWPTGVLKRVPKLSLVRGMWRQVSCWYRMQEEG